MTSLSDKTLALVKWEPNTTLEKYRESLAVAHFDVLRQSVDAALLARATGRPPQVHHVKVSNEIRSQDLDHLCRGVALVLRCFTFHLPHEGTIVVFGDVTDTAFVSALYRASADRLIAEGPIEQVGTASGVSARRNFAAGFTAALVDALVDLRKKQLKELAAELGVDATSISDAKERDAKAYFDTWVAEHYPHPGQMVPYEFDARSPAYKQGAEAAGAIAADRLEAAMPPASPMASP